MRRLELEAEESDVLKEVLEADVAQLLLEEVRADSRDYRKMLKEKEECLNRILAKLEEERQTEVEQPEGVAW